MAYTLLMRSRSFQCLLFSLFSCAFFLSAAQKASACTCGPRPTVLETFDESDEVVIVKVLSVEKVPVPEKEEYVESVRSATLIVEKVFKGKLKVRDEIVFGQGRGADCVWTFDDDSVGEQFLFYLIRPEKLTDLPYLPSQEPGLWFAFACGRSSGLAGARDDLLYLDNISKRQGKTRISGTLDGWGTTDLDVAGKRIKIIGPKKTYEVKTDKDGVFEIYDLPPGKYFVEPETPAGWKIDPEALPYSPSVIVSSHGQPEMKSPRQVAIKLEPKKHAGVDISFVIDNSVRGRVFDPNGKPMHGVCVYLWASGEDNWGPHDCTDKQGQFEITSISEGEYVLAANPDGKLSEHEPFERIFYPNVAQRDRAAVISVGAGDTIDNLDIVIPKLEETITIEGVLLHSDGKPAAKEWVKFKVTNQDSRIDSHVSETTDAAGRFKLKILKGLTGELAGEKWLVTDFYKNCPKVDELIAKSGSNDTSVFSNIIKLTTEQNLYDVELMLPFPRCEKKE